VDVAGDRRICPAPARPSAGHRSPAPLGETGSAEQAHARSGPQGFRNLCTKTGSPASAPRPSRPGPGRPAGSKNRRPVTRHDVGRVLATGEAYSRPAHHKKGSKPRRTEERQT
jgi:hypothetical protein